MKNLRHVWFIALNTLRLFVTDRTAVIMFILFPFLFIVMFNLLLGNTSGQDKRLELHLTTLESNGISQQIIQSLVTTDESKLPPGAPVIIWDKDYNQAKADVEAKKLSGFLAFPADFTQNVETGKNTSLEIVAMADATTTKATLSGLAQGIASRIGTETVEIESDMSLMTQQGSSPADIQKAVAQIIQNQGIDTPSLITYPVDTVGDVKPVSTSSFVVPGYLVMFVFFAAAIASVDLIRERRNHTLERLLAASVKKESILGGIYVGAVFRGLVQIVIFWTMGILVFHVNLGIAPWAVMVLSLLMVLMSAAFSVMLATIVKTERSASALAVLFSLLLASLGGCWWPLFIDPKWMQFLAKLTPHGWANDGFNKLMLFGATGGDVALPMLVLAGFAVAFIVIAVLSFRTSGDTA
jgi:ABC-2 type transport system permease protein